MIINYELNVFYFHFRILFLFALLSAFSQAHAGLIDSMIEKATYEIVQTLLIESGMPNHKAKCVVEILKFQGATDDVTDIRNLFQPAELAEKLVRKADTAIFICNNAELLIVLFVLILLLCCCIKCCVNLCKYACK